MSNLNEQQQQQQQLNQQIEQSQSLQQQLTNSTTIIDEHNTLEIIVCESYKTDLFQNLFRFRNENLFTDISIYVEGVEFKCHKVILCAASSYFKAMFSCDLKESRLGKVFIENISPWTMKRLIDFIYTGKIEINDDNVIDVFNASIMFNIYILVEKCSVYIQEHIDISNCIDLYILSEMHNLDKLKKFTFNYISDNFMLIYDKTNNDYIRLSDNAFNLLIDSDKLNIKKEIFVYIAICKWISHLPKQRTHLIEHLCKSIRYKGLTNDDLEYIKSSQLCISSNEHINLFNKTIKSRQSTLPREYICHLNMNKFEIYDLYKSKWDCLDNYWPIFSSCTNEMIENNNNNNNENNKRSNIDGFSLVVVNDNIYVTGGYDTYRNMLANDMWKFDTNKYEWCKCSKMLSKRAYHLSINVNESNIYSYIFVFYGITIDEQQQQSKINSLNNNNNSNYDSDDSQSNDNNDLVYIQSKSIEFYNINTNSWSILNLNNSLTNYYHLLSSSSSSLQQSSSSQLSTNRRYSLENLYRKRKSIVSLNNIIYVLQDNCIHCYQVKTTPATSTSTTTTTPTTSQQQQPHTQFLCLPYFRLEESFNQHFILATALSIPSLVSHSSSSSSSSSHFTWYSNDHPPNSPSHIDTGEHQSSEFINKHETLIYLLNPNDKLIYEFYPAKNRLKKLTNFSYKHSLNYTYLIKIKSNIYLTGGIISENKYCIEKYDPLIDKWSVFIDDMEIDDSNMNHLEMPLTQIFFKLKMSI